MRNLSIVILFAVAIVLPGCSSGKCPTKQGVEKGIKKMMVANFSVANVTPMPEVPGLCEVVLQVDTKKIIVYSDRTGKYIFSGSVTDTETKKNLTAEREK